MLYTFFFLEMGENEFAAITCHMAKIHRLLLFIYYIYCCPADSLEVSTNVVKAGKSGNRKEQGSTERPFE